MFSYAFTYGEIFVDIFIGDSDIIAGEAKLQNGRNRAGGVLLSL